MLEQRIQQHFIDSADLKYQAAQALGKPISDAVHAVLACITSGGKILACGDGASAAHAQQFAAFCVAGFERERPELAALALSDHAALAAPVGSGSTEALQPLARQVRALGQAGDLLLAVSVLGQDAGLLAAVQAAHERDMTVVLLGGRSGGALAALLRETDVLVCVPHERAARVREVHALALHALCDGVDAHLFGEQENNP